GIDKPISDPSAFKQLSAHQHDVRSSDFLNHIKDDHRDRLPAFAHFIVVDDQQQTAPSKFIGYPESRFIGWNNLYQSPDLYLPNPPP
ncbi:hypothetical protein J8J17_24005, partial [Mycobacterium tuberculosis]|nr:hypothetical protein [Mycobacterium tuberculosis]